MGLSSDENILSMESASLLLSEMTRLLRCQKCLGVPQDSLWYIKPCFHSFCRACLDDNKDLSLCPTCQGYYSHGRDLVIHRTYAESISGYHRLRGLLGGSQTTNSNEKGELNPIEIKDDEKKRDSVPPKLKSATPKTASSIEKPRPIPKNKKKIEDVLNRSLTINSTPGRYRTNLNKRNHQGETTLHVACCKGDILKVSQLLELGADPNSQDNAGWTPLHECAQKGYVDIAKLLLDKGVTPSVPGGPDNVTPLHDAVAMGSKDIIAMLIKKGANKKAMDSKGRTPKMYTLSPQIANLIDSTQSEVTESQALNQVMEINKESPILLYFENTKDLNSGNRAFFKRLDWRIQPQFGDEVTHVVFSTVEKVNYGDWLLCKKSFLYLETILAAKKAVALEWVNHCVEAEAKLDSSSYLIKGTLETPQSFPVNKSILNAAKRLPRLFDGMHFKLHNSVLNKKEHTDLIKRGSGTILKREPDPELIPEHEKRIPYHADPHGPLKSTSHYIIYESGSKKEPELKYDMSHIKTLSTHWIFSCIQNFSIQLEP